MRRASSIVMITPPCQRFVMNISSRSSFALNAERQVSDVSTLCRTQNPVGFQRLLIGQRGQVAIGRMTALPVIKHFDVFKDRRLGLLVRVKVLQRDAFGLSGQELRSRSYLLQCWQSHT
jgi:hypothetical protein